MVYLIYLRLLLPVRNYSNSAVAGWVHYWVAGWEHSRVSSWAPPVVLVASSLPVVLAVASFACLQGTAGRRNSSWGVALAWAWLRVLGQVAASCFA